MILNVSHISKAFSGEQIIRDASFFLNERDKAAITGLNGAGKTTLLNMITGELPSDSGIVTLKKDCTMGYLHQNNNIDSALTIREERRTAPWATFTRTTTSIPLLPSVRS